MLVFFLNETAAMHFIHTKETVSTNHTILVSNVLYCLFLELIHYQFKLFFLFVS